MLNTIDISIRFWQVMKFVIFVYKPNVVQNGFSCYWLQCIGHPITKPRHLNLLLWHSWVMNFGPKYKTIFFFSSSLKGTMLFHGCQCSYILHQLHLTITLWIFVCITFFRNSVSTPYGKSCVYVGHIRHVMLADAIICLSSYMMPIICLPCSIICLPCCIMLIICGPCYRWLQSVWLVISWNP